MTTMTGPRMSDVIDFPRAATGDINDHLARSTRYRLKASQISRGLEHEVDDEKVRALLSLALSWVQLAENEEWLGVLHRS